MKSHTSSSVNMPTIVEYMDDTYEHRESQITEKLKTATDIIREYPRMADCDSGSLVYKKAMFPRKN